MSASPLTLLADIGGTNVRFAVAAPEAAVPLAMDSVRRYRVADHASFADVARRYLADTGLRVDAAVLVAAGRVDGDEVKITNLPWRIAAADIRTAFGLTDVRLVNDFAGLSLCLPLLQPGDVEVVGGAPAPRVATRATETYAVIGPGTGLGVGAFLIRDGVPCVLETEGGHVSFAARSDEEWQVLQQLKRRFGRVSNERLLCGSGLVNIYQALSAIAGVAAPSDVTPERVTVLATAGDDTVAVRAVELFCEVFGAAAGDLVLAFGAWDGVYLTGGLLPAMLPFMRRGGFRRHFEDKGRFDDVMPQVPTVAIRHPEAGLLGAAGMARLIAGKTLSAAR